MDAKTADRDEWVSTQQAARELGVSPETIRRAAREGTLRPVRLRERGWLRFRASEVRQVAEQRRV